MIHNIVCLKWGSLYDSSYVNKLYQGIKRNTSCEFQLHCFTDDPTGIDPNITTHTLPQEEEIHGWWHKLYLFSDSIDIEGRVLYMDLDTLITGSLDEMLLHDYKNAFICLHDFFLIRVPNHIDRWGVGSEAVGSGVLSWVIGEHNHIWDIFIKDPKAVIDTVTRGGDQRWIQMNQPDREYFQDLFPNQLVSFKVHCRNGLPKNAR
ncbi:MAG: hypothetical protein ACQ9ET_00495, partial [Nitrosomonadaceae bacterium]